MCPIRLGNIASITGLGWRTTLTRVAVTACWFCGITGAPATPGSSRRVAADKLPATTPGTERFSAAADREPTTTDRSTIRRVMPGKPMSTLSRTRHRCRFDDEEEEDRR